MVGRRGTNYIVIKPADKGGAIVVWSKKLYLQEGHNQLLDVQSYKTSPTDVTLSNNHKVHTVIKHLITTQDLPTGASSLCVIDSCVGKPTFYMLPKIHKPDNPGRPIVSACSCPTEHISAFLDSIFNPLVSTLPSFLKDTNHALSVFSSIELLPDSTYRLFLLDVCSLYTSIPHSDGLLALQFFLDRRTNPLVSTSALLRLAELVLTLNSFQFNDQFFEQISGVAMGTKMGPSYACLFMGHLEYLVWHSYDGPLPSIYHRYIDDCIGITDMPETDLLRFINFINGFNPAIRFTSYISTSCVNFLDLTITINLSTITTSVYYKPTDAHSFLLYTSSHPQACRDSLPFSQLLRLRRLCSEDNDFLDRAHEMLDFFRQRLYPENVLTSAMHRVLKIARQEALSHQRASSNSDRVKLVLTFHPHSSLIKKVLFRHLSILQSDPETRSVFQHYPLVAYRRDRSLRDMLVHSRLQSNIQSHFGTVQCGRSRCYTCVHVLQTRTVSFPKAKFVIKDSFTCESRNLIYAITCKRCNKAYIGETGKRLSDRFAQHLRDIRQCSGTPVATHFNETDHSGVLDVQVTAIRSCFSDDRSRFALENRFISLYGTLRPHGLNVLHSYAS